MAGEVRPTSGVIRLHGADVGGLTPGRMAALRAVVPQASALSFSKRSGSRISGRDYTTLSGGERQRVHVARALCQIEPASRGGTAPLLLLDEATASLALAHQLLVMDQAKSVAARGGAVIAVLHDLNLAARYCDQIAVLRSGQLLAMGTVEAVIRDVTLSTAYGLSVRVDRIPETAGPCVLPQRAALSNAEFARDKKCVIHAAE